MLRDIYDSINENHVQTLLLVWLLKNNLPFSTVTTPTFKYFFVGVSLTLSTFVPQSSLTIHKDLEAVINSKMPEAYSSVQYAVSKIHLIFDAWFSFNRAFILSIINKYINEQYKLHIYFLNLTEMLEFHTEINFAK